MDSDFIIKTSAIKNLTNETLLEKTLKLSHDFYICEKVLAEIAVDKNNIILEKVANNEVYCLKFIDCLNALKDCFGQEFKRVFLTDLRKVIEEVDGDYKLYNDNFKELESYLLFETSVKDFNKEFIRLLNKISIDNNIGEISTLLMIKIMNRCGNNQIFAFMSDDNDARAAAIQLHSNLYAYNTHSLYILLKESGMDRKEAKEFLQSLKHTKYINNTVSYFENGSKKGIDIESYILSVFGKDNYQINRNGLPVKI